MQLPYLYCVTVLYQEDRKKTDLFTKYQLRNLNTKVLTSVQFSLLTKKCIAMIGCKCTRDLTRRTSYIKFPFGTLATAAWFPACVLVCLAAVCLSAVADLSVVYLSASGSPVIP